MIWIRGNFEAIQNAPKLSKKRKSAGPAVIAPVVQAPQ
jgi:hypothetical protein